MPGSSVQSDVVLLILIDNFAVLSVKVPALFVLNGGLIDVNNLELTNEHYLCESQGSIYLFYFLRNHS